MSRSKTNVAALAAEASLDPAEAILRLMEAGFDVESDQCVIARKYCALARRTLNLPRMPQRKRDRELCTLARRAGLTEHETRGRLRRAGILRKNRLVRIPDILMKDAERTLGLRKPKDEAQPSESSSPHVKRRKRTRTQARSVSE